MLAIAEIAGFACVVVAAFLVSLVLGLLVTGAVLLFVANTATPPGGPGAADPHGD